MAKRVFSIREPMALANALDRLGDGMVVETVVRAEDLRTAIMHLMGKAQRVVKRGYHDSWTMEDAAAVDMLIDFVLAAVKDADK